MDGTSQDKEITLLALGASESVREVLARVEAKCASLRVAHVETPRQVRAKLASCDIAIGLFCGPDAADHADDALRAGPPGEGGQVGFAARIVITGGDAPALSATSAGVLAIPESQSASLEVVLPLLIDRERGLGEAHSLRMQIETMESCRVLEGCLEPGKLYRLVLDALLQVLGCEIGMVVFEQTTGSRGSGIAVRGLGDPLVDTLCNLVLEEKALDTVILDRIQSFDSGPVHDVMARAGYEAAESVLGVPVCGEDGESGVLWILGPSNHFDAAALGRAGMVASYASASLVTAERYLRAKERAFVDDVTEVYNARYLLATAENEIQRAARYGSPLSVLFLDLDRFKLVNDRYGHLVGSETLRALSRLLGQGVRQVDTLARYGGDEFTILLVDTDHEAAMMIAERIRRSVEDEIFEGSRDAPLRLTISIGVATCPAHGASRDVLLDAADKAMYRAKSLGRNRICSAAELVD